MCWSDTCIHHTSVTKSNPATDTYISVVNLLRDGAIDGQASKAKTLDICQNNMISDEAGRHDEVGVSIQI